MAAELPLDLSRRERQIMETIYRLGSASAAEVTANLPDPPTSTAVRTMLRILEDKGFLEHDQDGVRFVYRPSVPREKARTSVLSHVISTFFNGSAEQAMASLLGADSKLSDAELDRLSQLIANARSRKGSRKKEG